jgi:ATP-dependent Zn protease
MINRGVKMGRRDSRPDERTAAFHEAGHVVIAAYLGLEIGPVTIVPVEGPGPGERVLGLTEVINPLLSWRRGDGLRRPLMESYVVALFAGCAAEGVLHGKEQEVDGADDRMARYWLEQMPPSRCEYIGDGVFERYERKLKCRAVRLVEDHFAEIRTIAELLLKRKTLQPDEIFEALGMQADC